MIKRPLHPRFSEAVLTGRKFTTIRDKPWPVGEPIMLYNWTGPAYRSKQKDIAPIIVQGWWPIGIGHNPDGTMRYTVGMDCGTPLHQTEGFSSQEEMDAWFRPLVKPNQPIQKYIMRFRLQ